METQISLKDHFLEPFTIQSNVIDLHIYIQHSVISVMGKSRAAIQKAYRERNRERVLEKDRIRNRKRYVPTNELPSAELKLRRDAINKRVKKYNIKQRQVKEYILVNHTPITRKHRLPLVKLKLPKRKRTSPVTNQLKREGERLHRENMKLKKRLQRLKCKDKAATPTVSDRPSTPRSRSSEELRAEGISPRMVPNIRKKLLFANALIDDINEKLNHKTSLSQVLSGKIIKKYRQQTILRSNIKVTRRQTARLGRNKRVRKTLADQLGAVVVEFLKREDNSTCMPGELLIA